MDNKNDSILLNGDNLNCELLYHIGCSNVKIDLTDEAWQRVRESRAIIEQILNSPEVVYGVNTGFGNFSNVSINPQSLSQLQKNLVRSHAAGLGKPLPPNLTRMIFALRINILAKGHSGISENTLKLSINIFNKNCLPKIPCQGTVGASGDLAPLSHLALGLMGEGEMLDPESNLWQPSSDVLHKYHLQAIDLKPKEGLALINGTQFITSIGAECLVRSKRISKQADCIAAMTVEALRGSYVPFNSCIHQVRPHQGQINVAARIRNILTLDENHKFIDSEIHQSHKNCGKVQDSYSLRCIPQIHGITHDTINFVENILNTELNSATDNPMIFHLEENETKTTTDEKNYLILSGGNFHGEYPSKALDYLAIGLHELSSVSERRLERLVNHNLGQLPPFLVENGGLNSGFMIAHCTSAALVSENKCLCHPSSVDSQTTSANQEDHVSMGGYAARKMLQLVENVERVLSIELLATCQALDLLKLSSSPAVEQAKKIVRQHVTFYDEDRYMSPDIEKCHDILKKDAIWQAMKPFII